MTVIINWNKRKKLCICFQKCLFVLLHFTTTATITCPLQFWVPNWHCQYHGSQLKHKRNVWIIPFPDDLIKTFFDFMKSTLTWPDTHLTDCKLLIKISMYELMNPTGKQKSDNLFNFYETSSEKSLTVMSYKNVVNCEFERARHFSMQQKSPRVI